MLQYTKDTYKRYNTTNQPVGGLLPGIVDGSLGQDETAEWLTVWADKKLMQLVEQLRDYADIFDPEITEEKWLDFLATPCGFVDDYWDTKWTLPQKRWMIANSIKYIWPNRGTKDLLEAVLNNFDIEHDLWSPGRLQFPFPLTAKFARPRMVFFVRLPISIGRTTEKWNLAEKLTRQYSAAGVKKKVVYKTFKLGFSKLGDPLFNVNRTVLIDDSNNFVPTTPLEEQIGGVRLATGNNKILTE